MGVRFVEVPGSLPQAVFDSFIRDYNSVLAYLNINYRSTDFIEFMMASWSLVFRDEDFYHFRDLNNERKSHVLNKFDKIVLSALKEYKELSQPDMVTYYAEDNVLDEFFSFHNNNWEAGYRLKYLSKSLAPLRRKLDYVISYKETLSSLLRDDVNLSDRVNSVFENQFYGDLSYLINVYNSLKFAGADSSVLGREYSKLLVNMVKSANGTFSIINDLIDKSLELNDSVKELVQPELGVFNVNMLDDNTLGELRLMRDQLTGSSVVEGFEVFRIKADNHIISERNVYF